MATRSDDYRMDDPANIDSLAETDKRSMRTNFDQHKIGARIREQVFGGTEKPLGRGLEDISHLFLTQRTDGALAIDRPASEKAVSSEPEDGEDSAAAVILQPHAPFTRDRLSAMLRGLEGALEEGLRAIDAAVTCHPCGEIDFLAVDRSNQLTIVDFETAANDSLLVRGIGHFTWIVDNLSLVRRMYAQHSINFSVQPRLFLLAPQFSPLIRASARQIARPRINWIRYQVVQTSRGPGIFFDPGVGE